ncbi:MAG: hypothetical protein B7Z67_03335 [Acidiphilium sp. 21-60-14]|nr:MAG: hypothetical protein B7Z67_03335 [Acidiphilium sp. 21-60-14]OYV91122.1 MAG: hypothetical protein B7Z57_05630 [Acidiphilium sp. 37-60-79]OZB39969.1 MAG: hypothetical protein B7X48_06925 [Acidiphilium sp. 34-60-192]
MERKVIASSGSVKRGGKIIRCAFTNDSLLSVIKGGRIGKMVIGMTSVTRVHGGRSARRWRRECLMQPRG